jgi:hypothetical protein
MKKTFICDAPSGHIAYSSLSKPEADELHRPFASAAQSPMQSRHDTSNQAESIVWAANGSYASSLDAFADASEEVLSEVYFTLCCRFCSYSHGMQMTALTAYLLLRPSIVPQIRRQHLSWI